MLIHKYQNIQSLKVCFWGPTLAGKTFTITAIKVMKSLEEPKAVLDFVTVADQETGRTVFFDQAVFGFGSKPETEDYLFKIHVFTTAGQRRLKETRKVVLQGIQGLVLVLDASLDRWDENIWSLQELKALKAKDILNKKIPYTVFVNKQDLPWGSRISQRHVEQLFKAAKVDHLFPNLDGKVFQGSCKNARKDLEKILRTTPRSILLSADGKFKREFRPESFNPLMKALETVVKEIIKRELRRE